MSLTFNSAGNAKGGSHSKVITPISDSISITNSGTDTNTTIEPNVRKGESKDGSCDVRLDNSTCTYADILNLRSGKGVGDFTITASGEIGIADGVISNHAVVEIKVSGSGVQKATISWKGSKNS